MARRARRSKGTQEHPHRSSPLPLNRASSASLKSKSLPSHPPTWGWPAAIALALATILAFAPALRAPFVYDDIPSIPRNTTIRQLWPPSVPLHPPDRQLTISGRPIVNYSLALNYAINQALGVDQRLDPDGPNKTTSYRILNLLLHLLTGALLFGVLRRTLTRQTYSDHWSAHADTTAGLVTALWLLHPIQSEAVNFIVQRTEIVVSACYLGTLYASIRAWDAGAPLRRLAWYAVGTLVCLLGMGSKEVMISAPLMVVLYDRAFRVTSWKGLFTERNGRPWFYLLLAATTGWLIALTAGGARAETVGLHLGMPWYRYSYSQAWAILHYFRLILWPDQLTLDYGRYPIHGLGGMPGLLLLSAFGAATILAWTRASRWGWFGFLGAWFFLLLGPSSSIIPIVTEIAAERRIYLAFASLIVIGVIGADALRRRVIAEPNARARQRWTLGTLSAIALLYLALSGWKAAQITPLVALEWTFRAGVAASAVAIAWAALFSARPRWGLLAVGAFLVATTFARSETYSSTEALWRDVIRKIPGNARAYEGLGMEIFRRDRSRVGESDSLLRRAIAIDSTSAVAMYELAEHAILRQQLPEAEALLERAVAVHPEYADALIRLGEVLINLNQPERAIPYLERVAATSPTDEALAYLGTAYMTLNRPDDAIRAFRSAHELAPDRVDVMNYLGALLTEQGHAADAIPYLESVVRRQPKAALTEALLSLAYSESGRPDDAVRTAHDATSSGDADPRVFLFSGQAMLRAQHPTEAEAYLMRTVQLLPSAPEAVAALGDAEAALGRTSAAAVLYRRALATNPNFVAARQGLDRLGVHTPRE